MIIEILPNESFKIVQLPELPLYPEYQGTGEKNTNARTIYDWEDMQKLDKMLYKMIVISMKAKDKRMYSKPKEIHKAKENTKEFINECVTFNITYVDEQSKQVNIFSYL